MDKDRNAGSAEQAKGSLKEAIGKITGNEAARAEGAAQKAKAHGDKAGKTGSAGRAKDA